MLSLLLGALIGAAPSDAGATGEPPSLSAVMPELKVINSTEPEFVKHWGRAMTELMAALERTDHARALALVDGLYEEVGRLSAEAPVQTQMGWRWHQGNLAALRKRVLALDQAWREAQRDPQGAWKFLWLTVQGQSAALKPRLWEVVERIVPLLVRDPEVAAALEQPLPVHLNLRHVSCLLDGKRADFDPTLLQRLVARELARLDARVGRRFVSLTEGPTVEGKLALSVSGALNTCWTPGDATLKVKGRHSSSTLLPRCMLHRPAGEGEPIDFERAPSTPLEPCRVSASGVAPRLDAARLEAANTLAGTLWVVALQVRLRETGHPLSRDEPLRGELLERLYDWGPTQVPDELPRAPMPRQPATEREGP